MIPMNCDKCKQNFSSHMHQVNEFTLCNSCFESYENERRELSKQYTQKLVQWLNHFIREDKAELEKEVNSTELFG